MKSYGLRPVIQKDEAVSPIIATILLVAITVILASTLYLALGGFFTGTSKSSPTAGLSATTNSGTNNYTVTVGTVSSNSIGLADVELAITVNGTVSYSGAIDQYTSWIGIGGTHYALEISANPGGGTDLVNGIQLVVGMKTGTNPAAITGFELYYTGSPAGNMEPGPVSP